MTYLGIRRPDGRQAFSSNILRLFGLKPTSAIPFDFQAIKVIDGVTVRIVGKGDLPIKRRVVAECPDCAAFVCAGHLDQHRRKHKRKPVPPAAP